MHFVTKWKKEWLRSLLLKHISKRHRILFAGFFIASYQINNSPYSRSLQSNAATATLSALYQHTNLRLAIHLAAVQYLPEMLPPDEAERTPVTALCMAPDLSPGFPASAESARQDSHHCLFNH